MRYGYYLLLYLIALRTRLLSQPSDYSSVAGKVNDYRLS